MHNTPSFNLENPSEGKKPLDKVQKLFMLIVNKKCNDILL